MTNFSCNDCHRTFTTPLTKPLKKVKVLDPEAEDEDTVKFCPFCGSLDIKEEKEKSKREHKG
jgi:hypothetical protein